MEIIFDLFSSVNKNIYFMEYLSSCTWFSWRTSLWPPSFIVCKDTWGIVLSSYIISVSPCSHFLHPKNLRKLIGQKWVQPSVLYLDMFHQKKALKKILKMLFFYLTEKKSFLYRDARFFYKQHQAEIG